MQADEIESLRQEKVRLVEDKEGLVIQSRKLAEDASHAKELAAAAAVELRNLAEEVTRLTYENAELTEDLAAAKEACSKSNFSQISSSYDCKQNTNSSVQRDGQSKRLGNEVVIEELQMDLNASFQREAALEAALSVKDEIEADLRRMLDEIKHQKHDLENELTSMLSLVAKTRKSGIIIEDKSTVHMPNGIQTRVRNGLPSSNDYSYRKQYKEDETLGNMEDMVALEELKVSYQRERRRCKELESRISRLKVSYSHYHMSYFIYVLYSWVGLGFFKDDSGLCLGFQEDYKRNFRALFHDSGQLLVELGNLLQYSRTSTVFLGFEFFKLCL